VKVYSAAVTPAVASVAVSLIHFQVVLVNLSLAIVINLLALSHSSVYSAVVVVTHVESAYVVAAKVIFESMYAFGDVIVPVEVASRQEGISNSNGKVFCSLFKKNLNSFWAFKKLN
jgi:hypothetical protein